MDAEQLTLVGSAIAVLTAALAATAAAAGAAAAAVAATASEQPRVHRYWVRPRAACWWETEVPTFNDEEFRTYFRVCRATFTYIVELVRPQLEKQDTRLRKAIPVETVTAVGLRRLATGMAYVDIGPTFAMHKSSVQRCSVRFVEALVNLQSTFICLPQSEEEVKVLSLGMEELGRSWGGWPGAVLDVDGTLVGVPFGQRRMGHADWRSRKGSMATNVQLACDYQTRIRSVVAGRHGSNSDARIFRESILGRKVLDGSLFFGASFSLPTGERIAYHVLGDGIYPACQLMHKAPRGVADGAPAWYEYCQSATRQPIEHCNGLLKGRWRTLRSKADYDVTFVPYVIVACCILHNICLDHQEEFDERLAPPAEKRDVVEEDQVAEADNSVVPPVILLLLVNGVQAAFGPPSTVRRVRVPRDERNALFSVEVREPSVLLRLLGSNFLWRKRDDNFVIERYDAPARRDSASLRASVSGKSLFKFPSKQQLFSASPLPSVQTSQFGKVEYLTFQVRRCKAAASTCVAR